MRPIGPLLILCAFASLMTSRPAKALWLQNGNPVSAASSNQQDISMVADGTGGAFVTFNDYRAAPGFPNAYVQRLDGWGKPLWGAEGIALSTASSLEIDPKLVSDGAGGVIAVWWDQRNIGTTGLDIYAQRVDAQGNRLWGATGVAVCTQPGNQAYPTIAPDGAGGALVAWLHDPGSGLYDVYAQRIDASGAFLWGAPGVTVCIASGNQSQQSIVSDGLGGAFICWADQRSGSLDIYAERVSAGGSIYFGANGAPICTSVNDQTAPKLLATSLGGVILTWQDFRGADADIYAQRIFPNMTSAWSSNGIPICSATGFQETPTICSDNAGGAIIAWGDYRPGSLSEDLYAQRVNGNGVVLWTVNGVVVVSISGDQLFQQMAADGAGGAVVAWQDSRDIGGLDVYTQRLNSSGVAQWPAGGVALCTAPWAQFGVQLVSDGMGGVTVAWTDLRKESDYDIYAQRVERNGYWGFPSPEIVSARDVPGDQGRVVNVAWDASRLDAWPDQLITRYTVWRAIDAAAAALAPALGCETVRHGVDAIPTEGDVVRIQETSSASYYWQLMATVTAYSLPGYAQSVGTLFDSTSVSTEPHHFQVMAHSATAYWASDVASGRSVDNLAPAAPLTLTAQRVGSDVELVWRRNLEDDLDYYAVYRATATGVQPIPIYFISNSTDTTYTDVSPPTGYLYYVVAAWDVHENQGPPSNEAAVAIPTGVGDDTPRLTQLSLDANVPNPFSGTTELRVGLPNAGNVAVEVYDVAGRRVAARQYGRVAAGWNRITFEALGVNGQLLPSGVYFYRVTVGTETLTRKMVIQR